MKREAVKKRKIQLESEGTSIEAELDDSRLSELVFDSLPVEATANTWGDEIYFAVPVRAGISNPVEEVEKGDIAYWPQGHALCVFFGETPISSGGKIIPAGPVQVLGRISGGMEKLADFRAGSRITVTRKGE